MSRMSRAEVFDPDEVAIGHFYSQTKRLRWPIPICHFYAPEYAIEKLAVTDRITVALFTGL